MASEVEPVIGQWYEDGVGRTFEVVAFDEQEGTVEIQYFDGTVEELDLETWHDMEVQTTAEPKDWSGPFDDLERDDLGDIETPYRPDGSSPLDEV